jgi:uncharacterized protein
MTIDREDIVTAVVAAAGGQLTSRVRLQKSVYLLDQLGLGTKFDYEYYHYGPYSRDLDNATKDAKALGLLDESYGSRKRDGAQYSIFTAKNADSKEQVFGSLAVGRAKELMTTFVKTNVTVLELAATIDWLWRFEGCRDWRSEVQKRKGVKAKPERLEQAIELLGTLGLKPPTLALA